MRFESGHCPGTQARAHGIEHRGLFLSTVASKSSTLGTELLRISIRILLCFVFAHGFPCPLLGQNLETNSNSSLWIWTGTMRSVSGYRNNLLLSRDAREKSLLIGGSGEVTATYVPTDRWHWQNLASIEGLWFPQGKSVNKEIQAFVFSNAKYDFSSTWAATLQAQYAYQDLVFDASLTETNKTSLPVRAHPIELSPGVSYTFARDWTVAVEANFERMNFAPSILDGYFQLGPVLKLDHRSSDRLALGLKLEAQSRLYDHRRTYSATGVPDGVEPLRYQILNVELSGRYAWDPRKRWLSLLQAGLQNTSDNGGGYFNYRRYFISNHIVYRSSRWELDGQASVFHYQYELQPGDALFSRRYRTAIALGISAEYRLSRHVLLKAAYQWEENRANILLDRYQVSTVSGGVGWDF